MVRCFIGYSNPGFRLVVKQAKILERLRRRPFHALTGQGCRFAYYLFLVFFFPGGLHGLFQYSSRSVVFIVT